MDSLLALEGELSLASLTSLNSLISFLARDRPVGSGKTALTLALCRYFRDTHNIGTLPFLPSLQREERENSFRFFFFEGISCCNKRYLYERRSRVLDP